MTKMMHTCRAVFLLLALFVAACAPYSLVPPATTDVANFRIEPDISWNKVNQLRIESSAPLAYYTADGVALNSILFIGGVKGGNPILKPSGATNEKDTLVFRDSMTAPEIVELWEAAIAKVFNTSLAKGSNIQPMRFGGVEGFRFDFNYVPKDEVDRKGVAYAAIKDGRLYMIFYSGTRLHHYDLRLASALKILETARITG